MGGIKRTGQHLQHRREIEGLRALAVIPVVLFHASVPGFGGGFAGVDIFFVISGYLITSTIMAEVATGTFTLGAFYERRARRLLPALFTVMGVSAIMAAVLFIDEDLRKFGQALGASALFGSNLLFAHKVGYFDDVEGYQPLLHLWSLSVEEQFYLLFPLAMVWLLRRRPGWPLPVILATLGLSLAAATAMIERDPQAAFFLLPTRAWQLMIGAACAAGVRQPRPRPLPTIVGLALIVLGFAMIGPTMPAPGPAFLLPTIGAALVLLYADPRQAVGRLLSLPPLTAVGAASYGIYLWHNPLLAFLHYAWFGPAPWTLTLATILLSVALGFASLHWIERPVRNRSRLKSRSALLAFGLGGMVLATVWGTALHLRLLPQSGPVNAGSLVEPVVIPAGRLAYVVYGDSHARQYYSGTSERFGNGALLSESACLSLPGVSNVAPKEDGASCKELTDRLVKLARERNIRTVYWAQRWERDLYRNAGGASLGSTAGAGKAELLAGIRRLAGALPPGTRIVLIGNVPTAQAAGPQMAGGYPRCRAYINVACPVQYPAAQAEAHAVNLALADLAGADPGIEWYDPAASLCGNGVCWIMLGDEAVYADHTHLTPKFAKILVAHWPAP
ncbi:acyltransferase family protein [Novosphingobium hassiacum]|uniref:acyltransferase family protein n=1 Tax=Novosphingobium hassiacum TaxID=173676 RepID=UPI001C849F05